MCWPLWWMDIVIAVYPFLLVVLLLSIGFGCLAFKFFFLFTGIWCVLNKSTLKSFPFNSPTPPFPVDLRCFMLNLLSLLSDAWILLKQQQKIIVDIGIQSVWMALVGHSLFSTSPCSYLVVCEVTKYSVFGHRKVKQHSYNWEHSMCYCFPWSFLSTTLCSDWSSHLETSSHLKAWPMIYFFSQSFTDSL